MNQEKGHSFCVAYLLRGSRVAQQSNIKNREKLKMKNQYQVWIELWISVRFVFQYLEIHFNVKNNLLE